MTSRTASCLALCACAALLGACAKKPDAAAPVVPPSVDLVKASEQSPHFQAVNSQLELGGTLYAYVDVDGDALSLAATAQEMARQIAAQQPALSMFAKQDFKMLVATLGLNDVKAIGVSSVREAQGTYRNRAFLYTPQGRHGLTEVFGGNPVPFVNTRMAPADVDYYGEYEFNLKAAYDTVEAIVAKVNGPEAGTAFREKVRKVGAEAHFSLLDLIDGLNGRVTIIAKVDPVKNLTFPAPLQLTLPASSDLYRIDGIGPIVEGVIRDKPDKFVRSQSGSLVIYTIKNDLKLEGIRPVIAIDGNALYLATTEEFLIECVNRKEGLDKNPAFQAALASVGPVGNGLSWVTPGLVGRIKGLAEINSHAAPAVHRFLEQLAMNIPDATAPMLSVRANRPDGILVRSTWNRSLKADVAMVMVYNPVTVGLMAAMAIPAFEKVRTNSQAMAITNNLRMLSSAADQYYLANGKNTAAYADLVGPGKYISSITPAAGESYSGLVFRQGTPLVIRLPDGRVFSYPPGARKPRKLPRPDATTPFDPSPQAKASAPATLVPRTPDDEAIVHNLRLLNDAANQFYAANGATSTTFADLVGPGRLIPALTPVAGESYQSLLFKKGRPLRLYLKDGRTIAYPPQQD